MERDLLAPGLHPLAVAGEPGLQVVLVVRQPAGPAPDIHSMGVQNLFDIVDRSSQALLDECSTYGVAFLPFLPARVWVSGTNPGVPHRTAEHETAHGRHYGRRTILPLVWRR
jgi:hypothetical protein